jgi:hypothetical protein
MFLWMQPRSFCIIFCYAKFFQDDVNTLRDDVKRLQSIAMTQHVAASSADAAAAALCKWFSAPLAQVLF